MKDYQSSICDKEDLRDEFYLAVSYLNLMGVSCNSLEKKYHISSRTFAKIRSGKHRLARNREAIYCLLMKELNELYNRAKNADTLLIIIEMARLHTGLQHDVETWKIINHR